jgi:hypothetical protein
MKNKSKIRGSCSNGDGGKVGTDTIEKMAQLCKFSLTSLNIKFATNCLLYIKNKSKLGIKYRLLANFILNTFKKLN